MTNKSVVIKNKEQIYGILMECYEEAIDKDYDVGEAIYNQLFFFADPEEVYNQKCQTLIKKYVYCTDFNCPPYPSLQETPANFVDDFLLIKNTIKKASKE